MGLNNFILTCEKDNEELRKDINYYKNMTSRLKKENQELKEKVKKLSQWDINKDTRNSRQRVANAKLLKENQELKKQLEKYENEPLINKISRIDCVVSNIYSRNKTQQKEFINYLEDVIKELQKIKETELDYDILKDVIPQLLAYKEILQKYKEITGDDNNGRK